MKRYLFSLGSLLKITGEYFFHVTPLLIVTYLYYIIVTYLNLLAEKKANIRTCNLFTKQVCKEANAK